MTASGKTSLVRISSRQELLERQPVHYSPCGRELLGGKGPSVIGNGLTRS